jgi:uncharacterized protein (PEP-CTERM system associated)
LREINYSESPEDRKFATLTADFSHPITALLSTGFYARYDNVDYLDTDRIDENYTIGGGFRYQLSRSLNSSLDLKYRERDSTLDAQNFNEWSAYINLAYGFGQPQRPTRAGTTF